MQKSFSCSVPSCCRSSKSCGTFAPPAANIPPTLLPYLSAFLLLTSIKLPNAASAVQQASGPQQQHPCSLSLPRFARCGLKSSARTTAPETWRHGWHFNPDYTGETCGYHAGRELCQRFCAQHENRRLGWTLQHRSACVQAYVITRPAGIPARGRLCPLKT